MTTYVQYCIVAILSVFLGGTLYGQHLVNSATGKIINKGVIRAKSDTGQFRNAAPYANIENNIIEFQGHNNKFTDLNRDEHGATSLGATAAWRVPGLVRYAAESGTQNLQGRYYTNLENTAASEKNIPDSVFVGSEYQITMSGPRKYHGTFYYDGTAEQWIQSERGMSGMTDRYNSMTMLNGPKIVRNGDEVQMDSVYLNDIKSLVNVEGIYHWGTISTVNADMTVRNGGQLTTGTGISRLVDSVRVQNGQFIVADGSDTVLVLASAAVMVSNDAAAEFAMGRNTRMDVSGDFKNAFGALTNTSFDQTSVVHYLSDRANQTIQATASSKPYGNVITSAGVKNASGDVHVADKLEVRDSNIVMVPHMMHLLVGDASYTNNAEVVGKFERNLAGAQIEKQYNYNNQETFLKFQNIPAALALDVRPNTDPNAFDATTDVRRKITLTSQGEWKATIRTGYKASDIPAAWLPTTSENLLKMNNAFGAPNPRVLKLTPTLPPTYGRRPLAQSTGLAYLELFGIQSAGPDNIRVDNGNDILLRGSRDVLRAIASGRWSDPYTWDEAREPEPSDRVMIDGFTVHVGYVRDNDKYTILEAHPDSLASYVTIANTPNTSLLFGSTGAFNTFSFVPATTTNMVILRGTPVEPQFTLQDVTAAPIDGGLIVYPGSSMQVQNWDLRPSATAFNGGTLIVGSAK